MKNSSKPYRASSYSVKLKRASMVVVAVFGLSILLQDAAFATLSNSGVNDNPIWDSGDVRTPDAVLELTGTQWDEVVQEADRSNESRAAAAVFAVGHFESQNWADVINNGDPSSIKGMISSASAAVSDTFENIDGTHQVMLSISFKDNSGQEVASGLANYQIARNEDAFFGTGYSVGYLSVAYSSSDLTVSGGITTDIVSNSITYHVTAHSTDPSLSMAAVDPAIPIPLDMAYTEDPTIGQGAASTSYDYGYADPGVGIVTYLDPYIMSSGITYQGYGESTNEGYSRYEDPTQTATAVPNNVIDAAPPIDAQPLSSNGLVGLDVISTYTTHYIDGTLEGEWNYEYGEVSSVRSYYPNGKLKSEEIFNTTARIPILFRSYNSDGTLVSEQTFDVTTGEESSFDYFPNGQLQRKRTTGMYGTVYIEEYHSNGHLAYSSYASNYGRPENYGSTYYEDGSLKSVFRVWTENTMTHSFEESYDRSGNIIASSWSEDTDHGIRYGSWIVADGVITEEGDDPLSGRKFHKVTNSSGQVIDHQITYYSPWYGTNYYNGNNYGVTSYSYRSNGLDYEEIIQFEDGSRHVISEHAGILTQTESSNRYDSWSVEGFRFSNGVGPNNYSRYPDSIAFVPAKTLSGPSSVGKELAALTAAAQSAGAPSEAVRYREQAIKLITRYIASRSQEAVSHVRISAGIAPQSTPSAPAQNAPIAGAAPAAVSPTRVSPVLNGSAGTFAAQLDSARSLVMSAVLGAARFFTSVAAGLDTTEFFQRFMAGVSQLDWLLKGSARTVIRPDAHRAEDAEIHSAPAASHGLVQAFKTLVADLATFRSGAVRGLSVMPAGSHASRTAGIEVNDAASSASSEAKAGDLTDLILEEQKSLQLRKVTVKIIIGDVLNVIKAVAETGMAYRFNSAGVGMALPGMLS